jgi:hypothetical protein
VTAIDRDELVARLDHEWDAACEHNRNPLVCETCRTYDNVIDLVQALVDGGAPGGKPILRSGRVLTDGDTERLAAEAERGYRIKCPDAGTCHHGCFLDGPCFRVLSAGPLSGVYVADQWPGQLRAEHGALRQRELDREAQQALIDDPERVCHAEHPQAAGWHCDVTGPHETHEARLYGVARYRWTA